MADNLTTPAIGSTLASVEIGGIHHPGSALVTITGSGASRAAAYVGPANPLPVSASGAALDILASARRWFAITPSTSNLATVPNALYANTEGAVVVRGSDGVDATFNVVAGQILPIRPTQVRTGTTATVIGLVS